MGKSYRVLLVDDFAPFRRFMRSTLQAEPDLVLIDDACDGLEAVQKARDLQPDLILLDIGLSDLNGIEAARLIRQLRPESKILVLSAYRSWDLAEAVLRSGASGPIVKSDTVIELPHAVESALKGKRFVSSSLANHSEEGVQIAGHDGVGFYF